MPKNLLFVFADQWRRQAVGFANQDAVITPNMDSFAKNGVWCDNAISSFPLCSPHRAALFTGRSLHSTGVFTNCKSGLAMRLEDSELGIAQVLCEQGYQTGYIGKWHLDEPEINGCAKPCSGANAWDAYTPAGPRRHGFEYWHSYGACDEHLAPHYWENSPQKICVDEWSVKHETDTAINYLQNRDKARPFCLFVSWNPPHSPYDLVPQKYLNLYNTPPNLRKNVSLDNIHHHTFEPANYTKTELEQVTNNYFAAVTGLDDEFGRLISALKQQNLWEDTVVVLSADHGDMLGSHALMAKHVWYEESVGIPFILGGGSVKAGSCGTVFGSVDIAPTCLDLLEVCIPPVFEGRSVASDLQNAVTDKNAYTIMAACPGRDVFLSAFEKAQLSPLDYGWRAVRTFTHTYVVDAGYEAIASPKLIRYLYNNEEDPLQLNPLKLNECKENLVAMNLEELLCKSLQAQNDGFLKHIKGEQIL